MACGAATIAPHERVASITLVESWRREDELSGAGALGERRSADLLATLPQHVQFDRCTECGLQMASPSAVWSAASYPRDQSYPVRWEFLKTVESLGRAPLDVLEVGCGTGQFLALAGASGHRAVGIDFSESAVAEAGRRGVEAFRGDIDDLARHLGSRARFDAVACFHVIEHLANPDALLSDLSGLLRPDARLFLSCPGPRRFTKLIAEQQGGASDFWDYPPQHVLRWTLPALRAMVVRHGWRVVEAIEEPFSWVAAGSHIGVVSATHRGRSQHWFGRRACIAHSWLRLLATPARRHGISLFLNATR